MGDAQGWKGSLGVTAGRPVVVVTGASRGLGRSLVRVLSRQYAVVGVARDLEDLTVLRAELESGAPYTPFAADLTDAGVYDKVIAAALEAFGRIDVLVNNAGAAAPRLLGELEIDAWRRAIDLHVTAPVFLTKAALPHLMRSPMAHVINISSPMARRDPQGLDVYGQSKRMLDGLMAGLRAELVQRGIRLTTVYPSGMRTHFGDREPAAKPTWWLDPDHVAAMIASVLASPPGVWVRELEVAPRPPAE